MKEALNNLGWLANGWTLLMAVVLVLGGVWKLSKRKHVEHKSRQFNHFSLMSYFESEFHDVEEITSVLKARLKIAIIDDDPKNLPIDYLRKVGFSVDSITSISLSEVERILQYDVVLLDIVGVVKEDPRKGGMELLKKIKAHDGAPIVIAISGNRFDPTATDFFSMAEDRMKKPIKESECEEIIIENINNKYSPIEISKRIDNAFDDRLLSHKGRVELMGLIASYAKGEIDDVIFRKRINKYKGEINSIDIVNLSRELRCAVERLQ